MGALRILINKNIGLIHISGIGGIGMSAIAEILHASGYQVQGSDIVHSKLIKRLESLGINIFINQNGECLDGVSLVVKSSAISDNNSEIIAAKEKHIPIISRSAMLAEIMRCNRGIAISGTHGKTTTTALVNHILQANNPTVINGGIIHSIGSNAQIGNSEYVIVEADESDGTFIQIPYEIAITTNANPEHMDYYNNDFNNVKKAYKTFLENTPFYGRSILCIDNPTLREIYNDISKASDLNLRKIKTYGFAQDAELRIANMRKHSDYTEFDFILENQSFKNVKIPLLGDHNVLNSAAAILAGLHVGLDIHHIFKRLETFCGVHRRFTIVQNTNGILVVDDYAHHPNEIAKTIASAKQKMQNLKGRLILVLQPHRYSRVQALMKDLVESLSEADTILITDIYGAGETPIPGVDGNSIFEMVQSRYPIPVFYTSDFVDVQHTIKNIAQSGDLILMLGAGSISKWASDLII